MERRNHNIRFNLQNDEAKKAWENLHSKEAEEDFKSLNAFAERMVQMVEQKVLANLPALAGMYQMQQSMMMADGYGLEWIR